MEIGVSALACCTGNKCLEGKLMVMTRHLTDLRGTCLSDPAELRIKTRSEQITLPDVL